MNETQIGEIWLLFADFIDKKQGEIVAERFVEFLVDQDISERVLHNALGTDPILDGAITYYLDDEDDESEDSQEELDF